MSLQLLGQALIATEIAGPCRLLSLLPCLARLPGQMLMGLVMLKHGPTVA